MKNTHVLAVLVSSVAALPAPQNIFAPVYCEKKDTIDSQTYVKGDKKTGDYTVAGGKSLLPDSAHQIKTDTGDVGNTLTQGSTFEVGVTVEVGGDIRVSDIAGVGLSASVAVTTSKATSQGTDISCPEGPWHCALAIYPEMLKVEGKEEAANDYCTDEEKDGELPKPFTVYYSVENDTGGIAALIEVCACTNKEYPHGNDEGAPAIKCDDCHL